jgi:hypothetical protein
MADYSKSVLSMGLGTTAGEAKKASGTYRHTLITGHIGRQVGHSEVGWINRRR